MGLKIPTLARVTIRCTLPGHEGSGATLIGEEQVSKEWEEGEEGLERETNLVETTLCRGGVKSSLEEP